uniref:At1g61320/AtMIF1 LRR domain-containing protein n=1 Tax=Hordeum vulgare subsp. vulgare TaxID=112509 RepID=A0A8I6XL26_HORVV
MDITRMDLEVMLSNCCYLKWLSLVRCSVKGELKLDRPLSNLRHLAVVWCEITRIELPILKLDTFVYHGDIVPIVINGDSMLENAQVWLFKENFDDAVRTVLNGIPRVQNLTLQILKPEIERQSLLNSTCMFSQLRCLQLLLGITLVNINKLPRVVSILRAAPSIEKLEIHFTGCGNHLCEAAKGTVDKPKYLEHCEYDYLKSVHMTGYKGARGQLEFLVHVVEKAPALEALTVDTALEIRDDYYVRRFCRKNACSDGAAVHARSCLGAIVSPNVKLCVM